MFDAYLGIHSEDYYTCKFPEKSKRSTHNSWTEMELSFGKAKEFLSHVLDMADMALISSI